MSEQLRLPFDRSHRGKNFKPPRLRTTTSGRSRSPHTRWEYWCGWCKRDHFYNKRFTAEQVTVMHRDHIENICKEKFLGRDPFG